MLLAIAFANLVWMVPVCIGFGIVGFSLRSAQLRSMRHRVGDLEKEMLQNHAEILLLQKENAQLADKLKNNPVPVIPITGSGKENTTESLPDVSTRKKLLSSTAKKHS
ncbi:MAG TPA: hypothetical protein VGD17_08595 [Chitinophagaceae bacterium]